MYDYTHNRTIVVEGSLDAGEVQEVEEFAQQPIPSPEEFRALSFHGICRSRGTDLGRAGDEAGADSTVLPALELFRAESRAPRRESCCIVRA